MKAVQRTHAGAKRMLRSIGLADPLWLGEEDTCRAEDLLGCGVQEYIQWLRSAEPAELCQWAEETVSQLEEAARKAARKAAEFSRQRYGDGRGDGCDCDGSGQGGEDE
jgi:hypothetical protein